MKGEQIMQRALALTIACAYCGAKAGERCVNQQGWEIEGQPAHNIRLRESGAI